MTEDINNKMRRKQTTLIVLFILIIAGVFIFITNYTAITGHNPAVSTTGKQPDIFEKLGTFLKENPRNLGWFVLGVVFLYWRLPFLIGIGFLRAIHTTCKKSKAFPICLGVVLLAYILE